MSHLLYPLFGTGPLLGKLLRCPFELIPDGDAPGLGLVQHLAGVFREASGHGVGLPSLEEHQIFVRPGFVKGVVHIPFPGHPVKQLGIAGQLDTGCRCTVGHELFHTLLAVGRLLGPVVLGYFPANGPQHICAKRLLFSSASRVNFLFFDNRYHILVQFVDFLHLDCGFRLLDKYLDLEFVVQRVQVYRWLPLVGAGQSSLVTIRIRECLHDHIQRLRRCHVPGLQIRQVVVLQIGDIQPDLAQESPVCIRGDAGIPW